MAILSLLAGMFLSGAETALAQGIVGGTANEVAGSLPSFFGGGCSGAGCFLSLMLFAIERGKTLIYIVALLLIVKAGFTMVYSQ